MRLPNKPANITLYLIPEVDINALTSRIDGIKARLQHGVTRLLESQNVQLLHGTAELLGQHEVQVTTAEGTRVLSADAILIATGSRPRVPDWCTPDGERILTTRDCYPPHIFPESMRGTGEGHYDWDLKPSSKMTNANVASIVNMANDHVMTVQYKGGEKKILVTKDTVIVTQVHVTAHSHWGKGLDRIRLHRRQLGRLGARGCGRGRVPPGIIGVPPAAAPGAGDLLAEARADRPDLVEALAEMHDAQTARCVTLERKVLAGIGGGCQQPLGGMRIAQGQMVGGGCVEEPGRVGQRRQAARASPHS